MAKNISKYLDLVVNRYISTSKFRSPLITRWTEFYKKWRNYLPPQQDIYRSNLFIPYSFQVVETIVPRLVAQSPKITVLPQEPSDEENATVNEDVLKWQWERVKLNEKIELMVRSGLIYGVGFLKIGWKKDMPTIENVDILDLFIDPDATTLDNAEFVIYRTFKTIDEIKSNLNYKNTDLVEGLVSNDQKEGLSERLSIQGLSTPTQFRDKQSKKIEILEYWEDDKLCVVAGRKVLLREETNPYSHKKKPFVYFQDYTVPNEFYGIGEIEHIEKLQEEANSLRNQIMDNTKLITNRMWKIKRSGAVNPRNVTSKPGGMILVNEKDDIDPLDVIPIPSQVVTIEQEIKSDIQQTTGVTDYQTGTGAQGTSLNDTATGISLIQEAGNMRFRLKMRHLEETVKRLGELMLANNQVFIQKPFVIRLLGKQGMQFTKVRPEDLQGNYDLQPEMGADEPMDKASQRQQLLNMVAILSQPQFIQQVNWQEIAQMILNKFNIDNVSDILMGAQGASGAQDAVSQLIEQKSPQEIGTHLQSLPSEDQQVLASAIQDKLNQANSGVTNGQPAR